MCYDNQSLISARTILNAVPGYVLATPYPSVSPNFVAIAPYIPSPATSSFQKFSVQDPSSLLPIILVSGSLSVVSDQNKKKLIEN